MKNIARVFVLFIFTSSLILPGPVTKISLIRAESEPILPEDIEAMLEEETIATDIRPNIVLIMTDDQRWDTIGNDGLNKVINQRYGRFVMPNLEDRIVAPGVLFTNAFTTTPESAPARASLLSGGFLPRDTGVLMNEWPNGGAKRFLDTSTMPVDLQESGYKTALIGRYMNEYNYLGAYIPPGWSSFVGIKDFSAWDNYSVIKGTSSSHPGQGSEEVFSEYIADFQEAEAIRFVEENNDSPFFLFLSAPAPHLPAIPASVDEELYLGYQYRGRGVNEENINDKPGIVRARVNDKIDIDRRDEFQRDQLRSLNALDRSIGAIMDRLEVLGELNNTVFIFTSDNGYLWGEHKLYGKGLAYDESVRVPFVVAMPGIEPGVDNRLIAADIDTAATILELAGLVNLASGQSFVNLLNNRETPGREEIIIERYGNELGFALIRTSDYKYVEYINGEKEFYDFNIDPTEKRNNYNNAAYKDVINDLKARLALKKGLVITTQTIPSGLLGQEYRAGLNSWGAGAEPGWALYDGTLPLGLTLNETTGTISGRPTAGGRYNIAIKLSGSELADQFGGQEFYIKKYRFVIEPSGTARLTYGPLVAAVTDNSAKIWFRVEPGAEVTIKYSIDPDFEEPLSAGSLLTEAGNDFTGTIVLNGLLEDMTYYYRLFIDNEDITPPAGLTFKTFPKKADSAKFVFLADFAVSPDKPAPSLNAVARENPDMVVLLGDIDHGNPQNLNEMRAMHRANRGDEKLSGQAFRDNILGNFPVAYVWDDHDYGGNNSDKNFSGRKQAIKAYNEYWPSYDRPRPEDGIWHKFSYGDLVEVFMLDLRSQRDPATYLDTAFVPDNERRANRDKLRYDTCRSLLDGNACPSGLPAGQKEWFKDSLFNSSARWKIVVTSVTWNPTTEKDEAWWDYKAEQLELMAYIRTQGISGVVFVSGDIHTGGAIDNGDNARFPELSVPDMNLGGPGTACRLHGPTSEKNCGDWSNGIVGGGSGFGLITATKDRLLMEAMDSTGQIVSGVNPLTLDYAGGVVIPVRNIASITTLGIGNSNASLEEISEITDFFYNNGTMPIADAIVIDEPARPASVKLLIGNAGMYGKLKGKILLKVEANGEAYYVNPGNQEMYYLGRPGDAFKVMREQGAGIKTTDLMKIPVGLTAMGGEDSDGDLLSDAFEDAVGTDPEKSDTDSDGHSDYDEFLRNFNPLMPNVLLPINNYFSTKQKGRIFLQVENNGEAWYVNPQDNKRYFLGRPDDAFRIMRELGLGISNNNFDLMSN